MDASALRTLPRAVTTTKEIEGNFEVGVRILLS